MTAETFADLVQAQCIGAGRWKARCPAHIDRSPSLSIRAGDFGRVLVLCRAGCALDSILSALKLARRDLFAGPPPSLQQAKALRASLEARQEAARAERKARLAALERVEKVEAVVHRLGAKLARAPEDDALAGLFDAALKRLRDAVTKADSFYPMRRASAQDKGATSGQASI